mmetsp:Transcript_31471/g.67990  ORF Transcript_31471/g.67990 Transcript_31471/m.67990 type:complete len:126 (-) Transcript_31471:715-1092(-)
MTAPSDPGVWVAKTGTAAWGLGAGASLIPGHSMSRSTKVLSSGTLVSVEDHVVGAAWMRCVADVVTAYYMRIDADAVAVAVAADVPDQTASAAVPPPAETETLNGASVVVMAATNPAIYQREDPH